MKEALRTILFTALLTAVCGAAVSGLQLALGERIGLNRTAARQAVALELLGLKPQGEIWPAARTAEAFAAQVEAQGEGERMRYRRRDGAGPVVWPFAGQGFWDRIAGYLAVAPDGQSLAGVAFTEQLETPGLGARIEEPWFRRQFEGLRIGAPDAAGRRIRIVPAGSKRPGEPEVDAITGASETSRSVEKIINEGLGRALAAP